VPSAFSDTLNDTLAGSTTPIVLSQRTISAPLEADIFHDLDISQHFFPQITDLCSQPSFARRRLDSSVSFAAPLGVEC
jgi:hypothetical protein